MVSPVFHTQCSSDSGAAIYVDGTKVKEGSLAMGGLTNTGGVMNIGQEQDSVGGSYDASQAFAGSLYNLNMFNVKLVTVVEPFDRKTKV